MKNCGFVRSERNIDLADRANGMKAQREVANNARERRRGRPNARRAAATFGGAA